MRQRLLRIVTVLCLTSAALAATGDAMKDAYSAVQAKQYGAALDIYHKVLASDSLNAEALYNSGYCLRSLGMIDSALIYYTKTLSVNRSAINTYLAISEIYSSKKDFAKAEENLSAYISLDTTKPMAYFNRCICNVALEHRKDAYADAMHCHNSSLDKSIQDKVDFIITVLGDRNPQSETKVFSDDKAVVSMKLPSDWNKKGTDDDKTMQLFISAEKVEKESDLFTLGASITYIRRLSKTLPKLEGKDADFVVGVWSAMTEKGAMGMVGYENYFRSKVISQEEVTLNNRRFLKTIRELQMKPDSYSLKAIELLGSFNDDLVMITLEAPADEFDVFLPMYTSAMNSLQVVSK